MEESSSKILKTQSRSVSVGSVILGSALISLAPFFVEYSFLNAMTSSFYRMLIGGVVFLLIALCQKAPIPRGQALALCCLAGIVLALDLITWNQSVLYIGSGLSTMLANLEVIFLVIIGRIFFKEKIHSKLYKTLLYLLIGLCCVTYPYFFEISFRNLSGIALGLGASLIYSIYLILLKMIGSKNPELSSVSTLTITCLVGALLVGAMILANDPDLLSIPNAQSLFCVIANSLLSQVAGWWFITTGIKNISLALSGMLLLTQPALTFLLDCVVLGRNTQVLQILGCLLLLGAIYWTAQTKEKKEIPI